MTTWRGYVVCEGTIILGLPTAIPLSLLIKVGGSTNNVLGVSCNGRTSLGILLPGNLSSTEPVLRLGASAGGVSTFMVSVDVGETTVPQFHCSLRPSLPPLMS